MLCKFMNGWTLDQLEALDGPEYFALVKLATAEP
jgi:hypothetical protein